MASLLLTPDLVTKLTAECLPGMKKPRDVIDRGCVGLALRLRPRGATWSFKMVKGGEERRIKLGTPAMLTLGQARAIAAAARRDVDNKVGVFDGERWLHEQYAALGLVDPPKPEKVGKQRDPEIVASWERGLEDLRYWTWEQACEAYLAEVKRTRRHDTWIDYRNILRSRDLVSLHGRFVRHVTRQELSVIVADILMSGRERQAEHVASVLRPLWNYLSGDAVRHRSGVEQPMTGLKAPERSSGTKARANGKVPGAFIAPAKEVGFLVAASRAGAVEKGLAVAMELLVTTGQRRRPIASALVADFVPWVETPGWGVWSMGPAHRKTADRREDRHRHCVPLPPALWDRVRVQAERARAAGSPYLFPQYRAQKAGGRTDGHMNPAAINHRLLDMALRASPHDIRRCLTNTCQTRFRVARSDVKLVTDHNEGIRSDDVLEGHYTADDRLDLKAPVMERYVAWVDEQAAAAALPDLPTLRANMARRRREREAAGKAKTAAAKEAEEQAKADAEAGAQAA